MRLPGEAEALFAVMHLGPRPTFGDTATCEVHILDRVLAATPERVTVEAVARLRDVQTFASPKELRAQIARDIADARGILGAP